MNDNHRRSDRRQARVQVSFRRPSGMAHVTGLQDLSRHGCRIEIVERMEPGQMIWVTLPGLQLQQTRVRWADEWAAGLEFEQPMHPSVFDHLAVRLAA